MISNNLVKVLKHLGFTFLHSGTRYKDRFEVIYKSPFHWDILGDGFSVGDKLKNTPYEDSPANTVCHYFQEENRTEFINVVISDIEKYIKVLNAAIDMLKKERDDG